MVGKLVLEEGYDTETCSTKKEGCGEEGGELGGGGASGGREKESVEGGSPYNCCAGEGVERQDEERVFIVW